MSPTFIYGLPVTLVINDFKDLFGTQESGCYDLNPCSNT